MAENAKNRPYWTDRTPCYLSRRGRNGHLGSLNQSASLDHAFDVEALHGYCTKNYVSMDSVFQAVWGTVVGAFANATKVCSGFSRMDLEAPTFYSCHVAGSKTAQQVIKSIETRHLPASGTNNDGQLLNEMNEACEIFDTALVIISGRVLAGRGFIDGFKSKEWPSVT